VYRAAHVPRGFRELRRISLAGNMLSDHTCKAYYEALLETHTVRVAGETPPRWTAFDEDDTWYVNVKRLCTVSNTERSNEYVMSLCLQLVLCKSIYMGEYFGQRSPGSQR
jgi:hypothetical protein